MTGEEEPVCTAVCQRETGKNSREGNQCKVRLLREIMPTYCLVLVCELTVWVQNRQADNDLLH